MRFAKLHGAGNDFILVDGRQQDTDSEALAGQVSTLCDRRLGIGGDGLLLLNSRRAGEVELTYWNADGSEAAFCGNGTRCAARYVADRWGWATMTIITGFAAIPATVSGSSVELLLPPPALIEPWRDRRTDVGVFRSRFLMVGVPHLVVAVSWDDFWGQRLEQLAPQLRNHPELPSGGANVDFFREADGDVLAARFWERGVEGETLSSGSGVVAVALAVMTTERMMAEVHVKTASGRRLSVTPRGSDLSVVVRGPAEWVAEGTVASELVSV